MANPVKTITACVKYRVIKAYECPNQKHWHYVDAEVELLPSAAQFLILSGHLVPVKIDVVIASDKQQKGAN
jgi:hypothetical protein